MTWIPSEILLAICHNLNSYDKLSFAAASKRFYDAAIACVLYRHCFTDSTRLASIISNSMLLRAHPKYACDLAFKSVSISRHDLLWLLQNCPNISSLSFDAVHVTNDASCGFELNRSSNCLSRVRFFSLISSCKWLSSPKTLNFLSELLRNLESFHYSIDFSFKSPLMNDIDEPPSSVNGEIEEEEQLSLYGIPSALIREFSRAIAVVDAFSIMSVDRCVALSEIVLNSQSTLQTLSLEGITISNEFLDNLTKCSKLASLSLVNVLFDRSQSATHFLSRLSKLPCTFMKIEACLEFEYEDNLSETCVNTTLQIMDLSLSEIDQLFPLLLSRAFHSLKQLNLSETNMRRETIENMPMRENINIIL